MAYSLWVDDYRMAVADLSEARRAVDEQLAGPMLAGVPDRGSPAGPDRETWGMSPEAIAGQRAFQNLGR